MLLDGSFIGTGDRIDAEAGMARQFDREGYDSFVRRFFEAMFTDSADADVKSAIIDRAMRLPADSGRALFTNLAGWDAARMQEALANVHCPLMAIQSTSLTHERKRVSLTAGGRSPWLDLVRQQVPTARLERLPDNGHFPHLEVPDEVSSLIADFVSNLAHPAT